ncbi:GNAT family N-acetyltransferase [Streptomyces liangshanensis]|uniref:GNAT family N-acetyltransferase n=1 Tax=Streptomyces liangshanensis TaxID=2717324 RepID=A0A6G9H493_9ACTN|nr:GNAT family N-acetyltransferase [Streptomyces liangshanensis]QIQ05109.1 GNAT family N-acetyltransferase [Streptomyces liangshanensis]
MTARLRPGPIGTERLSLVPLAVEHAREMAVVLGDPALHAFIGGAPSTEAELRVRYARMVGGSPDPEVAWCNWVLRLRAEEAGGAGSAEGVERVGRAGGGESLGDGESVRDAGGVLVGTVQATVTSAAPGSGPGRGGVAEIAWVVGTPWQGRGFASEAARGLVRWLEVRGVGSVIAHIHPDHHASAAVARACGLTPTTVWHDGEVRWERRVG